MTNKLQSESNFNGLAAIAIIDSDQYHIEGARAWSHILTSISKHKPDRARRSYDMHIMKKNRNHMYVHGLPSSAA